MYLVHLTTIDSTLLVRAQNTSLLTREPNTINLAAGWTFTLTDARAIEGDTKLAAEMLSYLYVYAAYSATHNPPTPSYTVAFRVGKIVLIFQTFSASGDQVMIPWPFIGAFCHGMGVYVANGGLVMYEGVMRVENWEIFVTLKSTSEVQRPLLKFR